MKITYRGTSHYRTLTGEDLEKLGVQNHGIEETLQIPRGESIEVKQEVGDALLNYLGREFVELHPSAEVLVEEKTKEELVEEARELGVRGISRMDKEALAAAIAQKRADAEADDDAET